MKRIVIAAVLLLLGVIIARPIFSRTGASGPVSTAASVSVSTRTATAQFTREEPVTFKLLHGHSGFWRIGQDNSGVWWFVSPQGKPQFLNLVTTVQPEQIGRYPDGPNYISRDWNGQPSDLNHWASLTLMRVFDTGFKGLGAWSHPIFHSMDVPMSRDLNLWDWVDAGSKRLYSSDWISDIDAAVKAQCVPLADNKNLIGYYTDNELDWGDDSAGPGTYFDHLPQNDPNRLQVKQVIQAIWPKLDLFNKDWNAKLTDWKDLDTWDALPKEPQAAYSRLFTAWLSHMASDYFRITTALVHKYDPNHLVLGVRYRGYAPPEVVRAAAGYTDVQSLNYYVGDAELDRDQFSMMYQTGHQPVVISEYSFHALDGRSGDRDLVGFSAQVPDQQARAEGYRLMTTRLARVPYVIGADWFQWMDEPPSGRSSDGEDVNFGIVDIDDRPYPELVNAVRSTAPLLNTLHRQSSSDDQVGIWRESFATLPVMHIPYLSKPITINGELSDWPPQAKLPGIRRSQTVGIDRNSMPLPNIYLGWTRDGLYLGFEVFDNDIEGAPPKGWWWTKDNVEFWISTHPVPANQDGYNTNCAQFFFVPDDDTTDQGLAGVVGQWHRDGDAIADNIIPQTAIHQAARILPDRYVVEMFIPASALHGWDPQHEPKMAFNIHVHNFQHALDYFWSAPKEVMTQLRPQTWGILLLDPPPHSS